ncbi:MAG: 6-phosphogluconolactonase [Candidatus Westeberhardia cardiocondylae]|nr:6-phosphogluconolactonase [Candidatus Westeberhardia cardiocondylae]
MTIVQYVYISNFENQHIHVFQIDSYGNLKFLQKVKTFGQGKPIVIHSKQNYLYLGTRSPSGIITYYIDNMGILHYKYFIEANCPTFLAINIQTNMLYCISYQNNSMEIYSINNGVICKKIKILKNLTNCHSVYIDNIRNVIWVPCLNINRIQLYEIDRATLFPEKYMFSIKTEDNSGPRHMVFHKNQKYAYVIKEFNSTVSVIFINTFKIIQTICMHPKIFYNSLNWAAEIHITPNSKWLYCSNRSTNLISCFSVSKNGDRLTLLHYQDTEDQPHGFDIDKNGKFLIVAGQSSHHITVYKINNITGELIYLSRYQVGKQPMWVSFAHFNVT